MTRPIFSKWILPVLVLLGSSQAVAETVDDFLARIAQAFASDDRPQALKDLFYLEGTDAETVAHYENRIIGRMLGKYQAPVLTLAPLPTDFDDVQVVGNYEYRPNLLPLGYVVLNDRTRVPYGRDGARYYFTGLTRTAIEDPLGPQKMLQMMVLGIGDPPVRYEGWCDVMQANRRIRRMKLEDAGNGGNTSIITAVRIEACNVRKLSAHGGLRLTLMEGEDEIFHLQTEATAGTITYAR